MQNNHGICPGCDLEGTLGQRCTQRACTKQGFAFIPQSYWAATQNNTNKPDSMLGQFVGDFLLVNNIGAGGFGKIYLGLQSPLFGLKGAVKLIEIEHRDEALTQTILSKFEGEAQALAALSHPNIVKLLKYGVHEQRPYLVMEYVDKGRTLAQDIHDKRTGRQPISLDFIHNVVTQLLHALEVAHANNIIHRDIKPDNLMIQDVVGNDDFLRVLDFGLAKFVERGDTTNLALGTPQYMAPEQLRLKNIGPWTDLYAVGVICFWLFTGQRPFPGNTQEEIIAQKLDPDFDPLAVLKERKPPGSVMHFLTMAMAHDAQDRFQTTGQFAKGFEQAIEALRQFETPQFAQETTLDAHSESLEIVESMHILFSEPVATLNFEPPSPAQIEPAKKHKHLAQVSLDDAFEDEQNKEPSILRNSIAMIVALGLLGLGVGAVIGLVKDKDKATNTKQPIVDKKQPVPVVKKEDKKIEVPIIAAPTPEAQRAHKRAVARTHDAIERAIREVAWRMLPRPGAISAAKFHTCVRLDTMRVKCWGSNQSGALGLPEIKQLGDDPTRMVWPDLAIEQDIISIATAGDRNASFTCAIVDDGKVLCWGHNDFGQLGLGHKRTIGDDEPITSAGFVPLADRATMIDVGASVYGSHACALLANGLVQCWGHNRYGQLGLGHTKSIGDDESLSILKPLQLGRKAKQITVGKYHTCALLTDGQLHCWGWNERGQLGLGHKEDIGDNEPILPKSKVALPKNILPITHISAGRMHTCATNKKGKVYCWGWNNKGQLGLGHTKDIGKTQDDAIFTAIDLPEPIKLVEAGDLHTCALGKSGKIYCWGDNKFGQLGLGHQRTIGDDESPKSQGHVQLSERAQSLSVGSYHACAILKSAHIRCWGLNTTGQLGLGHTKSIGDDEIPSNEPAIFWQQPK